MGIHTPLCLWRMDEAPGGTTLDSSGNGLHLGNDNLNLVTGMFGGAHKSYGLAYAEFMTLEPRDAFRAAMQAATDWTIALWAKTIFRVDVGMLAGNYRAVMNEGTIRFAIMANATHYYLRRAGATIGTFGLHSSTAWSHLALVYNGTLQTSTLYYNGTAVDTAEAQLGDWTDSQGFCLWAEDGWGDDPPDFTIDDARVYTEALTAPDIAQLFTNPYPKPSRCGLSIGCGL